MLPYWLVPPYEIQRAIWIACLLVIAGAIIVAILVH
jgi:hypothetical protein